MQAIKRQRQRLRWLLIVMVLITFLAALASVHFGRYGISISELWRALIAQLSGRSQDIPQQIYLVLWNIRLPRILASILVGSGLALSGAAFQALFENPMASPNVLGVNHGASLGAALAILLYLPNAWVVLAAFVLGLISVGLTYWLSGRFALQRTLALVLTGMMIGSLFQAGVSYIKLVADEENALPEITYWLMGSLSAINWSKLQLVVLPFAIGFLVLFYHRSYLNYLTLGEDKAQTLGIHLGRLRFWVVIGATLLSASSVAISGVIGWVGLIIPHICRQIVGSDYRYLLFASAFMGAAFLSVVDTLARTLTLTEIPIGILTAVIGAPVFFLLLMKGGMRDGH
ncbi:FecCD family ABC transporter permease [Hutsoniella sourekii]|uniref:FecCD family ABC transporter permease n=1 Tax=Hutsoniella sourekii TaxID=87650 RepID=UPI0012EE947B|nr:iron ABC transporter permease [Hutsoniella sourekii]